MSPRSEQDTRNTEAMEAMNAQVQLLRSRVEADLGKPAVVMVTSALPGDGKTLTAHSLAMSFGRSGHRVALAGPAAAGADPRCVSIVGLPPEEGRVTERDRLVEFIEKSRTEYDYTVIDAGTFLRSNTAMALAPLVDGILLTVRVGRAPSDDDELLVRTIDHSRGRIVGVVVTDAKAIEAFEHERLGERSAAALPAQRNRTETTAAFAAAVQGKA
jgi:Mrp family chromosome partitioning ATPase